VAVAADGRTTTLESGTALMAMDMSLSATAVSISRRYAECSRFGRQYVRWKLLCDPIHRTVLEMAATRPLGTVVDIGCGRGQMGMALLERQLADRVVGFDTDAARLAEAGMAAGTLPISFHAADARTCTIPRCDTVLLIDVLYQLGTAEQSALLRRAGTSARRQILIRTMDPDRGWRSRMSRWSETIAERLHLKQHGIINPRPVPWLVGILGELGFVTETVPCWQGTPFANVLLSAARRRPNIPEETIET
jgi:SAM-dependent methyltransferase